MEQLRDLMAAGVLRPVIAARFPLDRIAEAHAFAESRQAHGDVLVTPQATRSGALVEGLTRASTPPHAA